MTDLKFVQTVYKIYHCIGEEKFNLKIAQHFHIEYDLSKHQINATLLYIINAISRTAPYRKIQVRVLVLKIKVAHAVFNVSLICMLLSITGTSPGKNSFFNVLHYNRRTLKDNLFYACLTLYTKLIIFIRHSLIN